MTVPIRWANLHAAPQHGAAPAAPTPTTLRRTDGDAVVQDAVLKSPVQRLARQPSGAVNCLAAAVYYEARGEGIDGQEAVAQVVLNRVKSPHYPDTVCGVVYQGARERECQFSFACDGASKTRREPKAWRRARSVAERALAGHVMTKVGDATSFHLASLGHVWGRRMVRVAQVGRHVFFDARGHRARTPEAPATSVIASANGPRRS